MLEAIDELGLKPAVIVGTSMGAVIGAAYAAGMSGAEIRAHSTGLFRTRSEFLGRLWAIRPRRFSEIPFGLVGQYDLERVLRVFMPVGLPGDFAGLEIALRTVATDYYAGREVVHAEGPLLRAVAASAAMPTIFKPVVIDGRVLIDGGVLNPVPFDLVGDADFIVASDVVAVPSSPNARIPGPLQTAFGSIALLLRAILDEKLKHARPPDVLVRPPTGAFQVLEFAQARGDHRGRRDRQGRDQAPHRYGV